MSKESHRLTAKRIARLTKPGRYHDGYGLLLQITKRGSRSWLLRFERGGRERMLGLGPLHTVSPQGGAGTGQGGAADAPRWPGPD